LKIRIRDCPHSTDDEERFYWRDFLLWHILRDYLLGKSLGLFYVVDQTFKQNSLGRIDKVADYFV